MATPKGPSKTPRQQLSASMEHIRYAVTAETTPRSKPADIPEDSANDTTSPPSEAPPSSSSPLPNPSRSHDRDNNLKRSDPFQFGSRYLEEGDDPFEFNAWDHVETDAAYQTFSEEQYAFQRSAPVSDFDKRRFNGDPAKFWNAFYNNNKENFFKNRKWLQQEFPVLNEVTKKDAGEYVLLEVGAGAGNTAFPVLALNENEKLRVHACDFSKKAVELIRNHEQYKEPQIRADVWDAASSELPPGLEEESVDAVLMVFIFSALAPRQWEQCVRNIYKVLKPGGCVLFRDYGRGDLAQVRFKKGRYLEENFYIRGDGTRVYFFERDELEEIWTGKMPSNAQQQPTTNPDEAAQKLDNLSLTNESTPEVQSPKFEVINLGVDRRMLVNRQRKLKMYRCWMQAVFRKPGSTSLLDALPNDAISRPHPSESKDLKSASTEEG